MSFRNHGSTLATGEELLSHTRVTAHQGDEHNGQAKKKGRQSTDGLLNQVSKIAGLLLRDDVSGNVLTVFFFFKASERHARALHETTGICKILNQRFF